jgi:hypothetical protein
MPNGGTLAVRLTSEMIASGLGSKLQSGNYLHLSMAATGSGMDEATLARALEPFFSTKDVGNPMNKVIDCRAMELWCIERAKADPKNSWKWLGQAERWQELGHSQVACRFRPAKCPVHHPRVVEAFEWGRA